MSRAKMVILTDEQHLHVVLSVMTQLRADNATKRTPGDEYDKFLSSQIATGTETLSALNSLTVTATAVMASDAARGTLADLDGQSLRTVVLAMNFMLRALDAGPFVMVTQVFSGQTVPTPDAVRATLLFLEGQK